MPLTTMVDPFSAGMFASIGSALKFADVAVRIAEVGSENAVFVRAIQVVRSDLEEVERLLSAQTVQLRLATTPGKLPWVKTAINNTKCALNNIGKWVERARVEQESTGSIRFETRVRWVFNDHEKLVNRQAELSTCHQQLSNVLGYLMRLEDMPANPMPVEYGSAAYFDEILTRHRKTSIPKVAKSKYGAEREGMYTKLPNMSICFDRVSGEGLSKSVSLPAVDATAISDRRISEPPSTLPSMRSPPNSPPPAYVLEVPTGRAQPNTYPGPRPHIFTTQSTPALQNTDLKSVSSAPNDQSWAYRVDSSDMTVPELAGDTVSFSATNPAGPVDPHDYCATPTAITPPAIPGLLSPSASLAEMLGDIHFRVELPSNDAIPPPDTPAQPRASSRAELSSSRYAARTRATSDMSPRRPIPTNTISDSYLEVHEPPPSLLTNTANTRLRKAEDEVSLQFPTPDSTTSQPTYQAQIYSQPLSHSTPENIHSGVATPPRTLDPPIHAHTLPGHRATASSIDLAGSWTRDARPQPQNPSAPAERHRAAASRMQRQKQMLDLLGSIGT
ncbi:hypothetical protein N0V95_000399 [Ascochyta clinopodiicola]|nr:hypothetical protein N0V95_000399 [Ascochyta clinopodiicola]